MKRPQATNRFYTSLSWAEISALTLAGVQVTHGSVPVFVTLLRGFDLYGIESIYAGELVGSRSALPLIVDDCSP